MERCFVNSKWFLLHVLHWFHLLWTTSASAGFEPELMKSDKLALLDFKHGITQDPLQVMNSWNASIHFCNWTGVTCSPTGGRVMILNLESQHLLGTIPASIGNLTSLTGVYLQDNSFHGEVPQEIGRLQRLRYLNLTYNHFHGSIPTNLSSCTELRAFDARSIPAWIGNLSSLQVLSLKLNNLKGIIPKELGRISSLAFFQVSLNYLSGMIPSSIYNISSIYYFSVTQNQLIGQLPSDVGLTLPNLEVFVGGINNFTGSIPASLSNASNLQIVDFSRNGLTGIVPRTFGSLQGLSRLNFEYNSLGNGEIGDLNFLSFLANCTSLTTLGLAGNRFGGELPNSVGNLSNQLQKLSMGSNLIHGYIPVGIGNLVNLKGLGLERNYLSGIVPDVIGRLQNLEALTLNVNKISGSIPSSIGNLTELSILFMEENKFEGSIPPSLGNCKKLQTLFLSGNNLNDRIPRQVFGISSLSISLDMSNNFLTGSLPHEVGNLKNLAELDLSENRLSGEIPTSLDSCTSLVRLYLGNNKFEGSIPQSLKSLRGLEELDLSRNNLSGHIPEFLSKLLSVRFLNLSYNKLDGEVPGEGIFANASVISLDGNDNLCGGVPELLLPVCCRKVSGKHPSSPKIVISITIVVLLAILFPSSFVVYYKVKSSRGHSTASLTEHRLGLSYSEISKSNGNFSEENLIGLGSFGSVYKAILSGNRKTVAIKVLKLQQQRALKSFIDECKVLRSIRHRNILRVITVCSSIDHEGNDFKCLVFEFMSNGSLDKWLHPTAEHLQIKKLSLMQRLNIAIDVASAFDYLHHHCETPIVHCDLKPSNVLLDEDMTAHVGDFGLARFLFEASDSAFQNQTMSASLRGSIGYIPPEYMGGRVSILGDIYSYGILLLEMFTGKRPTDDMFKDDLSIHKFVSMALPDHIMDVVDTSLLFEEENENNGIEEAMIRNIKSENNNRRKLEECLVSVMRIGLLCSTTSPGERMAMNDVVNNLKAIRDSFLRSKDRNRGRRR